MTARRRWYLVSVVAAGIVALAGCERVSVPPKTTLRACYFRSQDFLPLFVIDQQGLAAKNGLEITPLPVPGGAAAIEAMIDGSLDLCPAVGTVPVLSAAKRGLIPDKIVPVAANNFADKEHRAVAVVISSSLQSWDDLAGRKIAVNAKDSILAAAVASRLAREGVGGYSFVEIPFANMGLAVAGGNVAAASMYEPFITQSILRGDGKLLDWVMGGGAPFERAEATTIVFSTLVVRQRPEVVKAYLRAHLSAVHWISANPNEARTLLARKLELTKEVGEKFNLLSWPREARNDPELLDSMQSPLIAIGLLGTRIPARRLYDETLLDHVLAEGTPRR